MTQTQKGELLALDVQSGRVLRRQEIGRGTPDLGGPVLKEERVYVLAADETLAVLDAGNDRIVQQHRHGSAEELVIEHVCASGPLLVGGSLYVATQTGGLRCLADTGSEATSCPPGKGR